MAVTVLRWTIAGLIGACCVLSFYLSSATLPNVTDARVLEAGTIPSFVSGPYCRGCTDATVNEGEERCGVLLQKGRSHPECDRMCLRNDKTCDNKYYKYDAVAPKPHNSRYLELPSLPYENQLPHSVLHNVTRYFLEHPDHSFPNREYFMQYNPSIVTLPPPSDNNNNNNMAIVGAAAKYLVSFRVSNQHYCFHPADRKRMAGGTAQKKSLQESKDYLGVAVLDQDLAILHDTIVNVKSVGFAAAQDFRFFNLNGTLFLGSYDLLAPIALSTSHNHIADHSTTIHPQNNIKLAPAVFAGNSNLQLWIGVPSCAPCNKKRGFCGKNFNYFMDGSSNTIMVEIWPTGPHLVRSVNASKACDRTPEPTAAHIDDSDSILSSFATAEEIDFPALGRQESLLTRGRGSACCIEIQRNDKQYLVGIQHSKTPSQRNKQLPVNVTANHYLSSLYAFEKHAPYRIVAQSGWFCLGFPSDAPLTKATSWRKLRLGRTYNCPRIHFVSGMTIKADDPNTVIIAYGVNDCLSNFVFVGLSDIVQLLFGPVNGRNSG